MPPTATYEDIKAYQDKVEKNKITPHSLPACPRCSVESAFFKIHAYRERRFLIIVEMFVRSVFCSLIRFRCPGCGRTVTFYPDFAMPHKHYTRPTIVGFSTNFLETDAGYQQATMVENSVPGYPNSDAVLAPSTIHRWITSLAQYLKTSRTALDLLLQENPALPICRDLAQLSIPPRKFRSEQRKKRLLRCLSLVRIDALFQATFKNSIFTNLAIACAFG